METLYRKVTFEIEAQDHNRTILIGKNANFIFNPNTKNGEELSDFLSGCKTVESEKESNLEKLKADKEELLEALEETNRRISIIKSEPDGIVRETMIDMLPIGIETLIQKHKQ